MSMNYLCVFKIRITEGRLCRYNYLVYKVSSYEKALDQVEKMHKVFSHDNYGEYKEELIEWYISVLVTSFESLDDGSDSL